VWVLEFAEGLFCGGDELEEHGPGIPGFLEALGGIGA